MKTIVKVMAALVILGTLFGFWDWALRRSERELQKRREIVNEVRHLIQECKKIGEADISIQGKCLFWDMEDDKMCSIRIPDELQATSTDRRITVFMLLPVKEEQVGRYSISKQPAFRRLWDVCVAYWPEKLPAGIHSFTTEPLSKRRVIERPGYTLPSIQMEEWIKGLPSRK